MRHARFRLLYAVAVALLIARAAPSAAQACAGDCDSDGRVTVVDFTLALDIALTGEIERCPTADADGDGSVSIADIFRIRNDLVGTCAISPDPVPTPAAGFDGPVLTVGFSMTHPPTVAAVPVTLGQRNAEVEAIQNYLEFDANTPPVLDDMGRPVCEISPGLGSGAQLLRALAPAGCTLGTDCTAVLLALTGLDALPREATVLYTCMFGSPGTPLGSYLVTLLGAVASDATGQRLEVAGVSGVIYVVQQFPATWTPAPTVTRTPTPSPTPESLCGGDCDGNLEVTIGELVVGVNIALERFPATRCPAFDGNNDGAVLIGELVVAVRSVVDDCAR